MSKSESTSTNSTSCFDVINRHNPTLLIEHRDLQHGQNDWITLMLCINNMLQIPCMYAKPSLVFSELIGGSPRNPIVQPGYLTGPPNIEHIFDMLKDFGFIDYPIVGLHEHGDESTYRVFHGREDEREDFNYVKPRYFVIKTRFNTATSEEEDFYIGCSLHGSTYYAMVGVSNVPVADIGNGLDALFTEGGRRNFIHFLQSNVRIDGNGGVFMWPIEGSVFVPIVINSGGESMGPWNSMAEEEIRSFFYPIPVGRTMNSQSNVSSTIQVLSVSTSDRDSNILNGRIEIVSGEEEDTSDAKWLAERNVRQRQR